MVTDSNTKSSNRPYAPPSNVVSVLQRLRARNLPEQVDLEYLGDAGVPDSTVHRTLSALHFLGLTDQSDKPSEALRSIHTSTDEEYRAILSSLIREAYKDVFEVVDPAEDGQDRILNVFRRYTPASQRARMVNFFLGMCREAGIPTLDIPRQRLTAAARSPTRTPALKTEPRSTKTTRREADRGGEYSASVMPPALEGLVRSLPTPGTVLSEERRQQWLEMAAATLAFLYPSQPDGDTESMTSEIADQLDEGGVN